MDKPLHSRFGHRRKTAAIPLLWQTDIPRLLGCQFSKISTSQLHDHLVTVFEDDSAVVGPSISEQATMLQGSDSPLIKKACMENILADGGLYEKRRPPGFRICQHHIHTALCILFRPIKQDHGFGDLPMIGYIDYKDIQEARKKRNRRPLKPDYQYNERLKRITPPDWSEDPYMTCILLSIAQCQYYRRSSPRAAAYRSCLLVTNSACSQDIYLFKSNIGISLLDQLDDICAKPKEATPFIIHRTKIDLYPYTNLRARILAELSSQNSALDNGHPPDGKRRRDRDLDKNEPCKRQKTTTG